MKITKPEIKEYHCGYPALHTTSKYLPLARFAARLRLVNLQAVRVGYDTENWTLVLPFWRTYY